MAVQGAGKGHVGVRIKGRAAGVRTQRMRKDWLRKRFKKQNGICALCGTVMQRPGYPKSPSDAATLDHIIPLARGGSDHWENTQAAHQRCNIDKGCSMPGGAP